MQGSAEQARLAVYMASALRGGFLTQGAARMGVFGDILASATDTPQIRHRLAVSEFPALSEYVP